MSDADRLSELIGRVMQDAGHADVDPGGLSEAYRALGEALRLFLGQVQEVYRFTARVADGDFSGTVPSRHNYLAGPIKDLYYKLKHLTWQAEQVAKGDYNQRVDFLGRFSDSFNFMIDELRTREALIRRQSEERLAVTERQNNLLRRQMARQLSNYQAYRSYTKSFQEFRTEYKEMMGRVYDLFSREQYEEGRLLIAQINDRMGAIVSVHEDYSDHDFVNAALMDIANCCQLLHVPFKACVHIPAGFRLKAAVTQDYIVCLSCLIYAMLEGDAADAARTLRISSAARDEWLTITVNYYSTGPIARWLGPAETPDSEFADCIRRLRELCAARNALFSVQGGQGLHMLDLVLHLSADPAAAQQPPEYLP